VALTVGYPCLEKHETWGSRPNYPTQAKRRLEWGTVSAAEGDCLKGVYGTAQAVPFHREARPALYFPR